MYNTLLSSVKRRAIEFKPIDFSNLNCYNLLHFHIGTYSNQQTKSKIEVIFYANYLKHATDVVFKYEAIFFCVVLQVIN